MFTGGIAEWLFNENWASIWNGKSRTVSCFGDGTKEFIFTTAHDLAAYTVEAISSADAEQGGFVRVESFRLSPNDIVKEINAARGDSFGAHTELLGSLEDAQSLLISTRNKTDPTSFTDYVGYSYNVHMLEGTWDYVASDVERFKHVKQTSLQDWFKEHPEV
jgi:hypothetical protein